MATQTLDMVKVKTRCIGRCDTPPKAKAPGW